jgi:hypothetical protein
MAYPSQRPEYSPLLSMPSYQSPVTLDDTTRRLCCAPYLDVDFARAVIREVVESERKSVPPSYGFDLEPVVRYCLHARRLLLFRYALVSGLLLAGFCLNFTSTIMWLGLCAVIVGLRSKAVRALPFSMRLAGVLALVILGVCFFGYLLIQFVLVGVSGSIEYPGAQDPYGGYDSPTTEISQGLATGLLGMHMIAPAVLALGMFLVLFLSRRHVYGIFTTELSLGNAYAPPRTGNSRVEQRLSVVAAMQRGNICVQDVDPFAGAGWVEHSWSFATSLRPRTGASPVAIDSVALNQRIFDAVAGLQDPLLPANERVPNVFVVPYVAADGYRSSDDPLIDPQTRTPRTLASLEAIAAIARSPQGGLRHYLRAVIPASGKEIRTPDGRPVLPAQDSGIGVTAFVHVAVEGGMLYTEFVSTVMPQVRSQFHLVDNLRPERIYTQAATHTLTDFLRENLLGPVHLVRLGWDTLRLTARMNRSAQRADELRFYDYGADVSVRELGAQRPTMKFMQVLDSGKYIKILDRAVTQAVIAYLDEQGVDTAEFRSAVTNVSIGKATFIGGQQSFGGQNTNVQNNAAPAPAPQTTGSSHG